jgi:hypothetical protein
MDPVFGGTEAGAAFPITGVIDDVGEHIPQNIIIINKIMNASKTKFDSRIFPRQQRYILLEIFVYIK